MLYRVDYMLAVLFAGLIAGFLTGKSSSCIRSVRIAYTFYRVTVILLALRIATVTCFFLTNRQPWYLASAFFADLLWFVFAWVFANAFRRPDTRSLLLHPSVRDALSLSIAIIFVLLAIGKAFNFNAMTDFFTQSGYPVAFLKLIIIAETFGGIALLFPWGFFFALIGLTIDMFGAIITHLHNRDSFHDSTDAVSMLIRLAAVAVLCVLRARGKKQPIPVAHALLLVSAAGVLCLLIALAGSYILRSHGMS
jgi:uncharacterized membrane protein YphA (DoxX/SURF4 family)